MNHGPNLDFDGPLTLEIHATPLDQAQAAYDAHMAKRITYDPKLPCDHPHNEAARRWAREKIDLDRALEISKALQGSTVVNYAPKPKAKKTPPKESLRDIVRRLEALRAEMATLDIWSKEWDVLRCRYSHLYFRAQAMAKETGEKVEIPDVPRDRRREGHIKRVKEHIASMEQIIAQMLEIGPGNPEWKRLQVMASSRRHRAARTIRDHGLDLRLPKIPQAWEVRLAS